MVTLLTMPASPIQLAHCDPVYLDSQSESSVGMVNKVNDIITRCE